MLNELEKKTGFSYIFNEMEIDINVNATLNSLNISDFLKISPFTHLPNW